MSAVRYRAGRFPPDRRLDWPSLVPLLSPRALGGLSLTCDTQRRLSIVFEDI